MKGESIVSIILIFVGFIFGGNLLVSAISYILAWTLATLYVEQTMFDKILKYVSAIGFLSVLVRIINYIM